MAMSLTGSGRTGAKDLTCGICREVYRSPRILPCFHTFCLYCLEGLVRSHNRSFPCPQCRRPTAVPPEGALAFQMNFYISEDELELERGSPKKTMCSIHDMEPLVFFCMQCDQAICIRCRLTKHSDHHDTRDLSEVAAGCVQYLESSRYRLEKTIGYLTKKSTEAQENLRMAKQKGTELKKQAQTQHDALVERIGSLFTAVQDKIDASNSALEKRLTSDGQKIQRELDRLVQLGQSVHHALSIGASDADKVAMEKEMREGRGSQMQLNSIKDSMPGTTFRPGLHFHSDCVSDDDIQHALGIPVELPIPFGCHREVIVPVFQYEKGGITKEVYGVCPIDVKKIAVLMWDPSTDKSISMHIDAEGHVKKREISFAGRWSYTVQFHTCYGKTDRNRIYLNSKRGRTNVFQVVHHGIDYKSSVSRLVVTSVHPLKTRKCFMMDINPAKPVAFDSSSTGHVIVVVEATACSTTGRKDERKVCLYHPEQSTPFAVYTPDDPAFFPSDVCFWPEGGGEKLLVADKQNDCVHVVDVQEDDVHFERYLAAGDSHLVRPTALNVDDWGRVWIGCENGRILRCQQEEEPLAAAADCDDDSDTSVSYMDESSLPVMVENASSPTDGLSVMSEADNSTD